MSGELEVDVLKGFSQAREGISDLSHIAVSAYWRDEFEESKELLDRINRAAIALDEEIKNSATRLLSKNAWRLGK